MHPENANAPEEAEHREHTFGGSELLLKDIEGVRHDLATRHSQRTQPK